MTGGRQELAKEEEVEKKNDKKEIGYKECNDENMAEEEAEDKGLSDWIELISGKTGKRMMCILRDEFMNIKKIKINKKGV
ncbi:hypothetical protein [Shigella flexneri]|uniref:hypothetical protein n=1 Tax=Shigella flexneri TaxID=623 RepID=UPI0012E83DBB|nr:hypothetical protein [Shigella flexneri]